MHSPLPSAALQNSLTAGLCFCFDTFEGLLFIQVYSDPTPRQCSIAWGETLFPLLNAALQISLTAGLCHCNLTVEDPLCVQV